MAFSDDLTTSHVPLHAIRPGLRLKPLQSHGTKLSDEEIDHVIERVLAEERKIDARKAWPSIASQDELSGHAGRQARRAAREREAAEARLCETRARYGADAAAQEARVEDLRPVGWLRALRLPQLPVLPRRAQMAIAGLAGLALLWFWPLAVFCALSIAAMLVIGGILALSSGAVSDALIGLYHWRRARNPAQAERMRCQLDALAMRIDILLDALPERLTTGLYMADFSREALGADMNEDATDPFDRLRNDAARE